MFTGGTAARGNCRSRTIAGRGHWRVYGIPAVLVMMLSAVLGVGGGSASAAGASIAMPLPPPPVPDVGAPPFSAFRQSAAEGSDGTQTVVPMATAPAAQFVPMAPARAVDTRADSGEPLHDGDRIILIPGESIPVGITAVAFNIVATGQTASGYVDVAPRDSVSDSSTVNWSGPQQTIANGHLTRVSAEGSFQLTLHSSGAAHLVLDITGFFAPPGTVAATLFTPTDQRLYDSRWWNWPLLPGEYRFIAIDPNSVPSGVAPTAAAINVTATGTTGSGVFSAAAFPTMSTSTINWSGASQTVANAVITDVWVDGMFTVTNNGATPAHLVVDLTGVFAPTANGASGAQFYAMDPQRSYDSRNVVEPLLAGATRTTVEPVPSGAVAIAINTTITGTTGTGYISVTPPTAPVPPNTSTVNWFTSPTTRANGSIVQVSSLSTRAYVGGNFSTHYVHDVAGYFS